MKLVGTAVLLLMIAQAADAFTPRWRWREDNADVFLAAWKESTNCPITYRGEGNIRLRTTVVPSDSGPVAVTLRYCSDPYFKQETAAQWIPVTNADTGAFFLSDSKYLHDGVFYPENAMLNIWYDGGGPTYEGTITIDSSSQYLLASKSSAAGYEFEYCLKPGSSVRGGAVYYFLPFLNGDGSYDSDPPCVRFPPFYWRYHKVQRGEIINVQFADSINGWYQAYEENDYGLWRTTDGGQSWTRLISGLSPCRCFFVTKDTGWAVIDNYISKSIDGGTTWTRLEYSLGINQFWPNSIFFLDTEHGWMTCPYDPMKRTSDGGVTWEVIKSPAAYLLSTYFLNERVGFAIGESIYKTTDGGVSWRLVQSVYDLSLEQDDPSRVRSRRPRESADYPLTPYVGQIQFIDSSLGWALAYNGKLCRTVDRGEHWTLQQTFRTPRALAMHFSDRLNGWIVGEEGMILATKDGGAIWEKRPSGTGHQLQTLEAVNRHLWIGASDGTILSSPSGGWTTAVEGMHAAAVPEEYILYQNFPNPFNPQTRIRYALPRVSHVRLRIYDVLGREVETLVDEQMQAGEHEAVWNASQYSSGVYVCRMTAAEHAEARMMALIK